MNWNQIEGNWEKMKGNVQENWGKLTGDDLDVIAGNRKQLSGKLQERYGKQEEEAEWEEAGQVLRSHMRAHAETQEDRPSFDDYMQTEAARSTFDRVCRDLFGICAQTSMGDSERETFVRRQGLQRMKSLYNEEYPRSVNDGPQSLFDILRET